MDDLYQFGNNRICLELEQNQMSAPALIARFLAHTVLAAAATIAVLALSALALAFVLIVGAPFKRLDARTA